VAHHDSPETFDGGVILPGVLSAGSLATDASGRVLPGSGVTSSGLGASLLPEITVPAPLGGGLDDAPGLNALIALLPTSGATLKFQRGAYTWATTVNLDSLRSVALKGEGGLSGGAAPATVITFTPSGALAALSARSTAGVVLEDLMLLYSSATYTGNLTDFSHANANALDSANCVINRCFVGGTAGARGAASLVFLDKANSCQITNNIFENSVTALLGRGTDNTHYSNAHAVTGNTFVGQTSSHITNPGNGWTITNNTFEQLNTVLGVLVGAGAITWSGPAFTSTGLFYCGNWHGDATAAGYWINIGNLAGGTLNGAFIGGNYFGAGAGAINIATNNTKGLTVVGNTFDSMANCIVSTGTGGRSWLIMGNNPVNISANFISYGAGGIPTQSLIQNENATTGDTYGMKRFTAGAVSDASFPTTPPDGTEAFDSTNSQPYIRVGGVWKKGVAYT